MNVVVEDGDGEIGHGQGFWPPEPNTECAAFGTDL